MGATGGVSLVQSLVHEQSDSGIYSLAFSPAAPVVACGGANGEIRLWHLNTGEMVGAFQGHTETITKVTYDPTGQILASASLDHFVKLWDLSTHKVIRSFQLSGSVRDIAFDADGTTLATGAYDEVALWSVSSGRRFYTLKGHRGTVVSLAFGPDGSTIVTGSYDGTLRLWHTGNGRLLRTMVSARQSPEGESSTTLWRRKEPPVLSVAYDPKGHILASGHADNTVQIWEANSGRLLRILEGHTGPVDGVGFSADGKLFGSKGRDSTIRLWRCDSWQRVAIVPQKVSAGERVAALAFGTTRPLLGSVGLDSALSSRPTINVWELDYGFLLSREAILSTLHYVNAKVVLVGDTGVGKSGLSLVLTGRKFSATDSTPGRNVLTFDSREVAVGKSETQTREILLWDLAGQPGYRIVHQLYLNEVAVALVVFDARSDVDPLAGVRHWERALRIAQRRQGADSIPTKKLLVSARADRGGVSVSKERIAALKEEFQFDRYFETSSKEGWQIEELRKAISDSIPWDDLPVVTSEELFVRIKRFLIEAKESGRLLSPASQLLQDFLRAGVQTVEMPLDPSAEFETCIGRLENRDLIRRLSFGDYVLLQPELLDAYASAMVIAAKGEPDGLGSIAEETALGGKFHVPQEQKISDAAQEQLLLHATVEELVLHDLALRENADDGRYIVFPSQFNRDYEDAPEPKGSAVAITFEGPVQSVYATLAVRLGHSGLFETGRTEMWRNAAVFSARAGGKCGLYMREFAEARGQLILFYDPNASVETRFHFEEYVISHLNKRALDHSIDLVRYFVCQGCSNAVPDAYVRMLRTQGHKDFLCPCGERVSLVEPKETLATKFPSRVAAMDKAANDRRDYEALIVSASGEVRSKSFTDWAGGNRVTLAIVFTDLVGSTAMENELGGERMSEIRGAHFAQGRNLIQRHEGREIKTIGDSFMVAFRSVDKAFDFASALRGSPGEARLKLRAGIHVGPMEISGSDVFGGTVNFAARIVNSFEEDQIWISDRAMSDMRLLSSRRHKDLKWKRRDAVAMKGFPDPFTLWSLEN